MINKELLIFLTSVFFILGLSTLLILIFINNKLKKIIKFQGNIFEINKNNEFSIEELFKYLCSIKDTFDIEYIKLVASTEFETVEKSCGRFNEKNFIKREFSEQNVSITLDISFKNFQGENKILFESMANFIFVEFLFNLLLKEYSTKLSLFRLNVYSLHLSHELKNALQKVNYIINIAKQKNCDNSIITYLKNLKFKMEKNLALTTDTYIHSKVNSGEFVNFVYSIIPKARCRITILDCIELPSIIIPVVDNVLSNIKKKMGKENIFCFIKVKNNKNSITISICDNGSKIDSKTIKSIFVPFISNWEDKSTGLGLYIAKEILKKNNGFIRVRNLKKGVLFFIKLRKP